MSAVTALYSDEGWQTFAELEAAAVPVARIHGLVRQ